MACVIIESYNPDFNGHGLPTYSTATITSEDQLTEIFISPSALHSQSPPPVINQQPENPVHVNYCNQQQLPAIPSAQVPVVHHSIDIEQQPGLLPDWVIRKQEQPMEPPWWESELAPSIHRTLKEREKTIEDIQFRSPQLENRQWLVDFLFMVCQNLLLSHGTRFLAVKLMDHFMDKHVVMDFRMKLVALTSLLVAAKFEETDENLPTIEMMQHWAQCGPGHADCYSRKEFHKMELYLLRFFNWSVSIPSSVHFADYYLLHGSEMDDGGSNPLSNPIARMQQLEEYNNCFLEHSLRDYTFLQYLPSQIAAAAVCASRMCVGTSTAWNKKLQSITGHSLQDISPIVDGMLKLLCQRT